MTSGTIVAIVNSRSSHVIEVALSLAVIATASVPLLWRVARRTFDLLEPLTGAALVLAVLFGVRPLAMIAQGDFTYQRYNIEPQFATAILVGFAGTLAFVLSYSLVAAGRGGPRPTDLPGGLTGRGYVFAFAVGAVSVSLFALYLASQGSIADSITLLLAGRSPALYDLTAGSSEYLSAAPILTVAGAIAVGSSASWKLSLRQWVLVGALIAFPVVSMFLVGNRRYIIPAMLVPAVCYFLSTGTRPSRKMVLVLAPVAFVLLATIPFGRAAGAREAAGGLLPIYQEAIAAPVEVLSRFVNGPDTEMLPALAVEIQILEAPGDFYYGRATIGDLLLAPIPSAVVPMKPMTARNDLLTVAFGAPCGVVAGALCPDFSALGTFYQDLWFPGVLIGMAMLGALSAAAWQRLKRPHGREWELLTAAWIVFLPILIRAGFMPAMTWFLFFTGPSLAGVVFVSRRRKATSPTRSVKPKALYV